MKRGTMEINRFIGNYRFLSNFYGCFIKYDGLTFKSAEAAYQSQKTFEVHDRFSFQFLSASEAKKEGYKIQLRDDWEDVKVKIMYKIVKAKFKQNEQLKRWLVDTGRIELIEGNTWGDVYWGTVNGVGENKLGKILMRVRKELDGG